MFIIAPVENFEEQKEYASLCGASYAEGYFAYSMKDKDSGKLMGFSQFEIRDGYGFIKDLLPTPEFSEDFEAMFILGRQTMNFMDLCGIHIAKANKNTSDERLLKAIGFKLDGDEYACNMTGFFDGNCSGHH